jgi:hypothetical protein
MNHHLLSIVVAIVLLFAAALLSPSTRDRLVLVAIAALAVSLW